MTRRNLSFFLLLAVFTVASTSAAAQAPVQESLAERIGRRLVDRGFEYVRVEPGADGLVVEFENRILRYDIAALQEAADIVFSMTGAPESVVLVPRRRGIRLASVRIRRPIDGTDPVTAADRVDALPSTKARNGDNPLSNLFPGGMNPSTYKLDIAIHPQLVAQFGSFSDAVRSQINLVPSASMNLWPGMQLYGELIMTVQNELEPADDSVRPGILAANQTLRLPGGVFVSATAGAFTRDRYGVDFEILGPVLDGRMDVLGRIGRTGYARYTDGEWRYASLDRWTSSAGVRYNLTRYDLSTTVRYGRYLADDTGWIVNVDRYFGEVRIGFFGISTDAGENAGFRIAIPLFMREHMRPRRIRLRAADRFDWTYRYRGLTDAGEMFDTGHSLDTFRGVWIAPFVPAMSARPQMRY